MTTLWAEIADREEAARESAKDAKAKIDTLRKQLVQLHRDIRRGAEDRPVPYVDETDTARKVVDSIRTDTGEVFRTRPMTVGEQHILIDHLRPSDHNPRTSPS